MYSPIITYHDNTGNRIENKPYEVYAAHGDPVIVVKLDHRTDILDHEDGELIFSLPVGATPEIIASALSIYELGHSRGVASGARQARREYSRALQSMIDGEPL